MRFMVVLATASLLYSLVPLNAQQNDIPTHFDVASVKHNISGNQGIRTLTLVPGGVRVINLPLATIVGVALRLQPDQVAGMPSWAADESYDITAKAPEGTRVTIDVMRPMLQALLADRFQLKTHHELRELSVYRLVRVGAIGAKLTRAAADCSGRTPPTAPDGRQVKCGASARPGSMSIHGFPILTLAQFLGPAVGRVVVDATGIDGLWDLDLEYAADQVQGNLFPVPADAGPAPSDGGSLFTALQEQLGLRLETGRAPVDVTVVDNLARPVDD
jgi:uncharacterized protein (TIGR03435 family)